jgi:hypothetical protein
MQWFVGFFARHRRRLARLVLGLGLIYSARLLWPSWPHETELEFELGPDHAQVVELRVAYLHQGEELHGVSFGFPSGAPALVRHKLSLPPGKLVLSCELRARDGGARRLTRTLTAPVEGVVRIPLGQSARGHS